MHLQPDLSPHIETDLGNIQSGDISRAYRLTQVQNATVGPAVRKPHHTKNGDPAKNSCLRISGRFAVDDSLGLGASKNTEDGEARWPGQSGRPPGVRRVLAAQTATGQGRGSGPPAPESAAIRVHCRPLLLFPGASINPRQSRTPTSKSLNHQIPMACIPAGLDSPDPGSGKMVSVGARTHQGTHTEGVDHHGLIPYSNQT